MKRKITPAQIGQEYARGVRYKQGIGRHGMFRQNEINERFYLGDQWHGAGCGEDRPLVRQNIIKRIADYKMAVIGSDPVAVTFSAEGIPETEKIRRGLEKWREGQAEECCDREMRVSRIACALSDHFAATAERLKFDDLKQRAMLDAYITGTGILYTYWDDRLDTGLFADEACTTSIRGDIVSELLHVDQLVLGDPTVEELQSQPYLIIAQQRGVEDLQRIARRFGGGGWQHIRPESTVGQKMRLPKRPSSPAFGRSGMREVCAAYGGCRCAAMRWYARHGASVYGCIRWQPSAGAPATAAGTVKVRSYI